MRKIHIVIIMMIAAAIVLIATASDEVSTYGTFEEAQNVEGAVKIVGQLARHKEMEYNPVKDPNYFSFFLSDRDGKVEKVVYYNAKPTDFENSEQVVITGRYEEDYFVAEDILLKCPSKYKDEESYLKTKVDESSL